MNLPVIPADKANHIVYGAAIAACTSPFVGPEWAAVVVAAAALAKEYLMDARDRAHHTVDWRDAAATFAGWFFVAAGTLRFDLIA